jgi:hypothetical protein
MAKISLKFSFETTRDKKSHGNFWIPIIQGTIATVLATSLIYFLKLFV